MAIAKVILNGEVQMDVTSDTVEANKLLSGETATKNDGTKVTGTFVAPDPVISSLSVTPTESEQVFSGAETNILESFMMSSYDATNRTITADVDFSYLEYGATYHVEGKINYYPGSGQVNRTVTIDTDWVASENGEIPFTNDNGGSVSKVTLSKTQIIVYFSVSISSRWSISYNMSDRRAFVFTRSVDGYKPVTVGGISSTYIGSAVPLRSNADMYKSEYAVYAPSGYYSSEALYTVPADEHTAPTINFDSNYGTIRATHNASDTIRNKHILSGTSNMFSDRQLPSLGAQTYTPTESIQYISSYQWLTGSQTIAAIPSSYVGSAVPMRSEADMTVAASYVLAQSGYYSSNVGVYVSSGDTSLSTSIVSSTGYVNTKLVVSAGYIPNRTINWPYILPTLSAQTYTPGSTSQIISSYQWLTGSQTIAGISLTSKTVDPSESIQVITANNILVDEQNKSGSARASSVSFVIDSLSSLESGKTYHIIGSATAKRHNNPSAEAAITFDTDWIYGTDIPFEASVANLVTSIVINSNYIAFRFSSTGDNAVYYLNLQIYEKGYDGLSQVTVNAIPSSYIIPYGTYSVTENGTYDIGSYASVDVSVGGSGEEQFFSTLISIVSNGYISPNTPLYSEFLDYYYSSTAKVWPFSNGLSGIRFSSGSYTFNNATVVCGLHYCSAVTLAYSTRVILNFPAASRVSYGGLYERDEVEELHMPICTSAEKSAFYGIGRCSIFDIPNLISADDWAFYGCDGVSYLDFPSLKTAGTYTFGYMSALTSVSLPKVRVVYPSMFTGCTNITSIYMPSVIRLSSYAFTRALSSTVIVNFPNVSEVGSSCFQSGNLGGAVLLSAETLGVSAFASCMYLSFAAFSKLVSIPQYAFSKCYRLISLYLLGSSVVAPYTTGVTWMFSSTPINGYTGVTSTPGSIYVKASLYDTYVANSIWHYYSLKFVSLTDEEIAALPFMNA